MIQTISKTFTGNGTNTIGSNIHGRILAVKAVADSNVTNSWDLTLTGATTGIPILVDATVSNNATTWWHPRQLATDGADGSAATDAFVEIPIANEAITCVSANAGTTGEITVTVIYNTSSPY